MKSGLNSECHPKQALKGQVAVMEHTPPLFFFGLDDERDVNQFTGTNPRPPILTGSGATLLSPSLTLHPSLHSVTAPSESCPFAFFYRHSPSSATPKISSFRHIFILSTIDHSYMIPSLHACLISPCADENYTSAKLNSNSHSSSRYTLINTLEIQLFSLVF